MCVLIRSFAACGVVLALAACNASTDDSSSGSTTQSATGVWQGTDSVSGLTITALINTSGDAVFIRQDGVQYTGSVQVTGDQMAVTLDGYSNFPDTFSDNSTYGLGTFNGTVSTTSSISGTLTFTTTAGTAQNGSWSMTYLSVTAQGSSLQNISGSYTDGATGAPVSFNALGQINSQNSSNGCVLSGTVSTASSSQDIYQVAYTYSECEGTYAVLNGVQFTGLAVLNTVNVTSPEIVMAVSGSSSSAHYGIVSNLTGS